MVTSILSRPGAFQWKRVARLGWVRRGPSGIDLYRQVNAPDQELTSIQWIRWTRIANHAGINQSDLDAAAMLPDINNLRALAAALSPEITS